MAFQLSVGETKAQLPQRAQTFKALYPETSLCNLGQLHQMICDGSILSLVVAAQRHA